MIEGERERERGGERERERCANDRYIDFLRKSDDIFVYWTRRVKLTESIGNSSSSVC